MSLKDKLTEIKEREVEHSQVDWDARKNRWIQQVNDLHAEIRSWLTEFEGDFLSFETSSKDLNEETLGSYQANNLFINISSSIRLLLEPIGSVIIGGYGRIDFFKQTNRSKKFMLILTKEENSENYIWAIADSKNKRSFKRLNRERFEDAMEQLIDG